MAQFSNIWRVIAVFFICILSSCEVSAQDAVFSANASATKLGVKDQIQVDYTIQNVPNLRSISRPDFKDFDVVGGPFSSQRSNVSVVGNKMVQSSSYTHSYILQPKKTGSLVIPPASAKDASGHTYESNAINVQVVQGSIMPKQQPQNNADPFGNDPFGNDPFAALIQQRRQAMQQRMQQQQQQQADQPVDMKGIYKDIFIKVSVDKNKAYLGEQITASYKLYARIPMNVGISKLPALNGFWTQDFDIPKGNIKPEEEVIDGKKYQVFLLKKSALFPQQIGSLTLDPAEAKGVARILIKSKQTGMFDDPFFQQFSSLMMNDPFFDQDMFGGMAYKDVPVTIKSDPVKITVLPLPEKDKPANYGNAVGNFTISGNFDKTNLTTDDALTYTLKINGSGNLKLIEAPNLNLPNGLTTYDPQIIDTITGRTTTITGSKIFTYSISPNVPGDYKIPAIPFTYYNLQTKTYTTLYTQPAEIQVAKGKHYNPSVVQSQVLTDIHPIDITPIESIKLPNKPVFFSVGYWAMYLLPLLAFIGILFWKKRDDELSRDTVKLRNKRANKVALKRLVTAQKLLKQNKKQPFHDEVSKAIWLYLSDKLNIPLSSLSREKMHEVLSNKNVPSTLTDRIDSIIDVCETALYASSSGAHEMEHTYNDAVEIISKLEETIKK